MIISFDMITQNYTVSAVDDITNQLENIKSDMKLGEIDEENLKKQTESVQKSWEERYSKMAFYIEHDELEKVENNITSFASYIELKEYNLAINKIEEDIFLLDHIKDKYELSLENIF